MATIYRSYATYLDGDGKEIDRGTHGFEPVGYMSTMQRDVVTWEDKLIMELRSRIASYLLYPSTTNVPAQQVTFSRETVTVEKG